MRKTLLTLLLTFLILAALAAGGIGYFVGGSRGFSTRQAPTALERVLAREARHLAIPRAARDAANPMALTPELLVDARRHFADHCATCHANDGSGDTEIGRMLYPKAPDMRQRDTQSLSDGELYFIIHNGIRLSGMPAWGSDTGHDHDSWALVHFIRHLPNLSAAEIEDMKHYNPRSPAEMEEEKEEEEFLNGNPKK
jgi:mono/diheme cytochrome c family protein